MHTTSTLDRLMIVFTIKEQYHSEYVCSRKIITSNVFSLCMPQHFVNNVDFRSVKSQNDFIIDRLLVMT